MRTMALRGALVVAFALVLLGAGGSSQAQQIIRNTIDAGGGRSSGGDYVVEGTFGQPDAGTSTGADYRLHSGFWPPHAPLADAVFADSFE